MLLLRLHLGDEVEDLGLDVAEEGLEEGGDEGGGEFEIGDAFGLEVELGVAGVALVVLLH